MHLHAHLMLALLPPASKRSKPAPLTCIPTRTHRRTPVPPHAAGKEVEKKKPVVVKYGINHITTLVESGKAQLVVIAHDVDPIEIVVWLPALCKKMNVPYCIVKVRGRAGAGAQAGAQAGARGERMCEIGGALCMLGGPQGGK